MDTRLQFSIFFSLFETRSHLAQAGLEVPMSVLTPQSTPTTVPVPEVLGIERTASRTPEATPKAGLFP